MDVRLSRDTGEVDMLVHTPEDDNAWEPLEVLERPPVTTKGPRFQLFVSGIAARHTFLIDTGNGRLTSSNARIAASVGCGSNAPDAESSCKSTGIPVHAATPAQTKDNKSLAEQPYHAEMAALAKRRYGLEPDRNADGVVHEMRRRQILRL